MSGVKLLTYGVALFVLSHAAQAAPLNVRIVSDGSWRSTDVLEAGWETRAFDDSGWSDARAPYPNPSTPQIIFGGPTSAQFIWHDPDSTSPDGGGPPDEVFLRYSFDLNITPSSLPLLAQGLLAVDDDFRFYVNGALVLFDGDEGFANKKYFVDFSRELVDGANVIGIHARDGGWSGPFDRGYQWVLFDGLIRTVPEPGSLALLGLGLAGLGFARRRRA